MAPRTRLRPFAMLTVFIIFVFFLLRGARAFRIVGSENETRHFVPYERGFVERTGDPRTFGRERVNQGYQSHTLQQVSPNVNRLQSCPGMVGPLVDDKFYCHGKEYGYCDRRTGTCFCNSGYEGLSCDVCSQAHIMKGSLCYPKKLCPNDCSGSGKCDFLTGICDCKKYREGIDCSQTICSKHHEYCTHCNKDHCLACVEGYSIDVAADEGDQCQTCSRFDPRCRACNTTACLSCTDLLLTSIRRSGKRKNDNDLPTDELKRELSTYVPFGSQQMNAFDEAEHYFVVDPSLNPLNLSSMSCDQGTYSDSSYRCYPIQISNTVCGNYGTINFLSPEYEVWENDGHIRLTIRRSGGGVGIVVVDYSIHHTTSDDKDVTPAAFFSTNQTITFYPGQIQKSFLVTIHDDRILEQNKTFSVILSSPTGGATLGNQWKTIVTIIDEDSHRTCSKISSVAPTESYSHFRSVAGKGSSFAIQAKSCIGENQFIGGDQFGVVAFRHSHHGADRVYGSVDDENNGRYLANLNITKAGKYDLNLFQLIPGGFLGYYYQDSFLSTSAYEKSRVDAVINFTWAQGPITNYGSDFVSVRWEGFILAKHSGLCSFWLETQEHVRMWIDGFLLIDEWDNPPSGLSVANHDIVAGDLYEININYRELGNEASIKLLWSSDHTSPEIIPSSLLFYKEHLEASPLKYTVIAAEAEAHKSRASGTGLYKGIAGKDHRFTITGNDAYGNFRGDFELGFDGAAAFGEQDLLLMRSQDGFHAAARLISNDGGEFGPVEVPVGITYNQTTRKYDANFIPSKSGTYSLSVTLSPESLGSYVEGRHLFGSPFLVSTSPGATFAPESLAYGGNGKCAGIEGNDHSCSGIHFGLAGAESTFFIQSLDVNRNRRDSGGDGWAIILQDNNGGVAEGKVLSDSDNGVYNCGMTPITAGTNLLSVTLNGVHARNSPYVMLIRHGKAHGPSSFLISNLAATTIFATIPNILVVQTVDEWGNFIESNEHDNTENIKVENIDPHGKVTETETKTVGGTFQIVYEPEVTGVNKLQVWVNGKHINGSIFEINVFPGDTTGSKVIAYGPGLADSIAGDEASFTIQSKDGYGNNKTTDEASIFVSLTMENISYRPSDYDTLVNDAWGTNATLDGNKEYIGEGAYLVKYNAIVSGKYTLTVKCDGSNIIGSPFSVQVVPAATSAWNSTVTGSGTRRGEAGTLAPIHIYARDSFGNFVQRRNKFAIKWVLKNRHQQEWESVNNSNELDQSNQTNRGTTDYSDVYYGGSGIYFSQHIPAFAGNYSMAVTMYQPGGLLGKYFSSPYFEELHLAFIAVEGLNKIWEYGAPVYSGDFKAPRCADMNIVESSPSECFESEKKLSANMFTVEWSGKLLAAHSEEYRIFVECDDGSSTQLLIRDEEVVPWESCYRSTHGSIVLSSTEYVDVRIRYRKDTPGHPFFLLKWSSPSMPEPVIISEEYLHREVLASGKKYSPLILPNAHISPTMSTAVGSSLTYATAGDSQNFVVECRDGFGNGIYGNLLLTGHTHVYVHARKSYQLDGPSFDGQVTDNGNGTYTIQYLPLASGFYTLSVTVRDTPTHEDLGYFARDQSVSSAHVQGSPFQLTVKPNKVDPLRSSLYLTAEIEAEVAVESSATLHSRDRHGNLRISGGDTVVAYIFNQSGREIIDCRVFDKNDGTYLIRFTPIGLSGSYRLHVMIITDEGEKLDVQGSPYNVTVYPGDTDAKQTHVVSGESFRSTRIDIQQGTVWRFLSTSGNRREFQVMTKDKFGNVINRGRDHFNAEISGDTNIALDEKLVDVVNNGNGIYTFAYTVSTPGHYHANIALASQNGLLGHYYTNHHLGGEPLASQLDKEIDFDWGIETSRGFFSVRWAGYISFPHDGFFTFKLNGKFREAILWIDGFPVVDTNLGSEGIFSSKVKTLYRIRLEFVKVTGSASILLLWSSKRMTIHKIPPTNFFATVSPIMGSPFEVIVT